MDDPTTLRLVFDPGKDAAVSRQRIELDLGGRTTPADVFRPVDAPGGQPLPAVLFIPGDAPQSFMDGLLEWGQYRAWGEAVAARGMAAVVAKHDSTDELRRAPEVAAVIRDTLNAVRRDGASLGIDPGRVAIWTASGGASYGAIAALEADPPVAALVVYYGVLDIRGWAAQLATLDAQAAASVSAAVVAERLAHVPPTLLVTAGNDNPLLNATVELFAQAIAGKGDIERLHHRTGQHAFDILDNDTTSVAIIARTLDYLVERLLPG